MRSVKEFMEYGKRKGLKHKAIRSMTRAIFHDLRGVEHLIGGFMGLRWNGCIDYFRHVPQQPPFNREVNT